MRGAFLAAILAAISAIQSQTPIRSGVELIRLDVLVVDASGKPVTDLQSNDFTVKVDGAQRPVSFATFYGSEGRTTTAPPPTAVSPFATNLTTTPGRAVVFVVDLEGLVAGHERVILETASKLIDSLGPTDSVGLFAIPSTTIELTRDRARVKNALLSLRGTSLHTFQKHAISMTEADAFEKRDAQVIKMVVERECSANDLSCPDDLRNEAKVLVFESNRRVADVVNGLATLNERLRLIDVPKSIVFVSGGLPFPDDSRSRFFDLQKASASAGTQTYVIQVEQPESDASRSRPSGVSSLPRGDLGLGLSNLAGVTRGEFYSGVGRATGIFDRIRMEVTNTYQLGIQSNASDADGRSHKIDVQVTRRGLTVKAKKELTIAVARKPITLPVDVLKFPMPFAEAPMTAAAYSTQGDDPPSLKVIVLVELLEGAAAEPASTYAIAITNEKDQEVFVSADKLASAHAVGARAVTGIQLAPGQYRLRGAVVDSSGKRGSVDLPLTVGLRQAGPFQASDLLLGQLAEKFEPQTHLTVGTPITALLELYGTDPQQLDLAAVDLELRKSDEEAVLARGEADVSDTDVIRKRAAAGQIPTTDLTPGMYDVSAIIRNGAARVGIVGRKIVLSAR